MTSSINARPARRPVNPKTWLVLGLSFFVLSLVPFPLPSRVILLAVQVALVLWAVPLRQFMFFVVFGMGPVAVMAWLIQAISRGGGHVYAAWHPMPGIAFEVTSEGIYHGVLMAVQILNFGSACALLSLPTTAGGLRRVLHEWHLPPRLIFLIVASLNAPHQLAAYAQIAVESARARGMAENGFWPTVRLRVRTLATLFTLVLLEHNDRALSLEQRAIESRRSRIFLHADPDSFVQRMVRIFVPLIALGLTWYQYGGAL